MPNLELEIRFRISRHIATRPGKLYTLRADLLNFADLAEQSESVAGLSVLLNPHCRVSGSRGVIHVYDEAGNVIEAHVHLLCRMPRARARGRDSSKEPNLI